ncbi:response regulator [Ideonella sp. BN130291]|uniref:response regulator n=1 Tax=Ideonella sp. BN130291 TaxID=3112940 RepID=UPI002E26524C|nr:response regulator [Ideonella sp. BN130291]
MKPAEHVHPPHRVLVLDNNRDYADSIGDLLRLACDWDVDVAYDGSEGLSQAIEHPPDAVLMDLEVDDQSGFDIADRMQHALGGRVPPLVAVTGNADLQDEAAHDKRFAQALLKPASTEQLVRLLNGLVEAPDTDAP